MAKQTITRKLSLVPAALLLVPVFSAPAHAYVDPGTASIVLQSLIGGIAAAGLFFRSQVMGFYYKIFPGRGASKTGHVTTEKSKDAN